MSAKNVTWKGVQMTPAEKVRRQCFAWLRGFGAKVEVELLAGPINGLYEFGVMTPRRRS